MHSGKILEEKIDDSEVKVQSDSKIDADDKEEIFEDLLKEIRHDLVTYDKGDFGINYEIANERRDYVKKV